MYASCVHTQRNVNDSMSSISPLKCDEKIGDLGSGMRRSSSTCSCAVQPRRHNVVRGRAGWCPTDIPVAPSLNSFRICHLRRFHLRKNTATPNRFETLVRNRVQSLFAGSTETLRIRPLRHFENEISPFLPGADAHCFSLGKLNA